MPPNLFPAEVTVLSSSALGRYLDREYFPHAPLRCRLFWRSIHDVYTATTKSDLYFFKVYRQGLRSREEIQSEVDLLNCLQTSGIRAVRPVARQDGSYIGQFETENGVRYGVLYTSVGVRNFDQVEETDQTNAKLGRYLASIHAAWDQSSMAIRRWNLDAGSFVDESIKAVREFSNVHALDVGFLEEVARKVKEKLTGLSRTKPQFGVCHGDFYSGNVRLDADDNPVLFDFDFCGNGWRAYDTSMYAFPFTMGCDPAAFEKRAQRREQFLNGYNQVRTMSEDEVRSVALFIPFRRIFNIGTLYISYMQNTWGDSATIRNVDDDVLKLKKWVELNPVL